MGKITVRHAVAAAYGLLFGRPFTVLGLTWLPAAFYGLGTIFLLQRLNAAAPASGHVLGAYALLYSVGWLAATAFFGAVIGVPLTRQAFGLREETVAAHLVVGVRELRLFFALLRYYGAMLGAAVLLAMGAGIAITQVTQLTTRDGVPLAFLDIPVETWMNSVGGAAAVVFFLTAMVRYGFFLDAMAAAEDGVRLARARGLSRGNFWSLAAICFIVGAPAGILLAACEMTFGGLAQLGAGPVHAVALAVILTTGLVVLHALFAGASAGAYSELAEAHVQANDQYEPEHHFEPAGVFAAAHAHEADYGHEAARTERVAGLPEHMQIATPEADRGSEAAQTFNWMAPPPDAHFGSDPHDAQQHETQLTPASAAVAAEQAAVGQEHDDRKSGAPQTYAGLNDSAAQIVGFDGHPVPDHAQNAEFPPPPLDPVGAMSAQQGFHTPG